MHSCIGTQAFASRQTNTVPNCKPVTLLLANADDIGTKCLYTGLAVRMPWMGWLYTGLEKKTKSYSMRDHFRSVDGNK